MAFGMAPSVNSCSVRTSISVPSGSFCSARSRQVMVGPGLVKAVEKINAQNDKLERKLGYK